jgi:hypothetical protein
MKIIGYLALSLLALTSSLITSAQQTKRPFTVADEIGLTLFDAQGLVWPSAIHFSPDGKHVAVWTERGRVDMNQVEDSLRFYRTEDIQGFLKNGGSAPAQAEWVVTLTGKQYPVIESGDRPWRWLADSSGVAFVKFDAATPSQQLMLADLGKRTVEPLTPSTEWVRGFDVRDRLHYVYVVGDFTDRDKKLQAQSEAAAFPGTGVRLENLFFPDEPLFRVWGDSGKALWAVVDGQRFAVKHNGMRVGADEMFIGLSPDGRSLATIAQVAEVPPEWARLYRPPQFHPDSAGSHPVEPGHGDVKQWVLIDLKSGSTRPLVDAPNIYATGLGGALVPPAWSSDGQQVLLPETFVKSKQNEPSRPCIALADIRTGSSRCIIMPKYGYAQNTDPVDKYHRAVDMIFKASFAPNSDGRVLITFFAGGGDVGRTTEYQLKPDGSWKSAGETVGEHEKGPGSLELKVTRGVNDPPLLVAANQQTSRVLWDPNPQLKDIELAKVSSYKWKDVKGREWEGGLYKPANYQPGHRYPVVIQTHGYTESEFRPSGAFSTAFAAQGLAADGIMVLQIVKEDPELKYQNCESDTPNEASCVAETTESAVKQLLSDGIADPDKIGIIGFSRTCYYVVDMLTKNSVHFKAASITDGVMMDYFQYLLTPSEEPEMIFGGKPFGDGLQRWVKDSPSFNFDKVNTPLLVNALHGRAGALLMYSPYAQLHQLKKPVDLMVFNVHEHILSNPAARIASQGGSVDWFRFWLQGYEDPDPAKAEQYKRWRELRTLQAENDKKAAVGGTSASLSKGD